MLIFIIFCKGSFVFKRRHANFAVFWGSYAQSTFSQKKLLPKFYPFVSFAVTSFMTIPLFDSCVYLIFRIDDELSEWFVHVRIEEGEIVEPGLSAQQIFDHVTIHRHWTQLILKQKKYFIHPATPQQQTHSETKNISLNFKGTFRE